MSEPTMVASATGRGIGREGWQKTGAALHSGWNLVCHNPVFLKELRMGLRERRIIVTLSIYTAVIALTLFLTLFTYINEGAYRGRFDTEAGRTILVVLAIVQAIMAALIAPSISSTAISSEREKQTLDMIHTSLITTVEFVLGKLLYVLSFVFLLITISLPLFAILFFLGGVSPTDILLAWLGAMILATLAAQLGLYFSARDTRSGTAVQSVYGILILGGLFFMPMLSMIIREIFNQSQWTWSASNFAIMTILAMDVLYFSLLLWYKTLNRLEIKARYILAMHRMFVFFFFANLALLAIMMLNNTSGNDLGVWWAVLVGILVPATLVFFLSRPMFPSRREYLAYRRSISSRPAFFPLLFILGPVLPGLLVYMVELLNGKTAEAPVAETLMLNAVVVMAMYCCYRAADTWIPHPKAGVIFYLLVAALCALAPLPFLISGGGQAHPPLSSLLYASPWQVIGATWTPGENSATILIGATQYPSFAVSIIFFIALALLMELLRRLGERRWAIKARGSR